MTQPIQPSRLQGAEPRENPLIPLILSIGIAFGVTVLMVTVFNYASAAIAKDLGLTPAETAGALSLHLAVLIVALPLAGATADKVGARPVILVSAVAFGLAIAAIAHVPSGPSLLYLAFIAAGIAGAGVSPVSYNRVIVHRFHRNRGLALGVALSGTGLGGMILPWIVQPMIAEQGWRPAFLVLAAIATAAGLFAGLLAGRERSRADVPRADTGASLAQAIGTRAFWQMGIAFALLGIAIAGFMSQLTAIFSAKGLAAASVPAFHTTIGAATIAGRLAGGALMDRVPARLVGAGAALIGAIGLSAFAAGADSSIALLVIGVAIGLCTGAESDVVSYLASRFYGVRNFARIYAVQGSIFMIGLASGPLLGALALSGIGVGPFLAAAAALLVVSSGLLFTLRAPPSHEAENG
jgi:MFS family permease